MCHTNEFLAYEIYGVPFPMEGVQRRTEASQEDNHLGKIGKTPMTCPA